MAGGASVGSTPCDLLPLALAANAAGLCVLPPRQDGSKQPDATHWAPYHTKRSNPLEIERWYAGGRRTGIGFVCGVVSGHLELFEFDDADTYERYVATAVEAGLGPLVERIGAGYAEATPGGGVHWYYRLSDSEAKTAVLARRPAVDSAGKPRPKPLIETKGNGGYAVAAPSNGGVHPTGGAYRILRGGPTTIAVISAAERDALWSLARTFDEMPRAESLPTGPASDEGDMRWGVRPGDDFNARATWAEILEPQGWEAVRTQGDETLWRRPDGYPGGWGASTNFRGSDLLYVWTTAAPPFAPDKAYSKFAAYALLNHGGRYAEAARALASRGYGRAAESGWAGASIPVESSLSPVPPFPVEALPPVARELVRAGALALGCPPDFIVPHLLAFAGAAAGNSRRLRIKDGYVVAPIFWVGVVGKPGTAKSPALGLARAPLDILQREAWTAYGQDLERWGEQTPAERGPKPRPQHFFATDTTTEAIALALTSSRGIAITADELAAWVNGFNSYKGGKGGDRQSWLSSWSGAPLKPNRKSGEPIYVPEPVVCVTGTIQPEVLPDLAGEAARDDGFIPRLLLSWPDADPAPWSDASVSDPTVDALINVFRALRLPGEATVVVSLTADAYAEWVGWYNENQAITATSSGLAAGWAAKAPVHLARIALVLHLFANPGDHARRLDVETLGDAIAVVEYYRAHLARVMPAFGASAPRARAGLVARVLRILARAHPDWVGRADLAAKLGGHESATAVTVALATLSEQGQAASHVVETTGRPREEWCWVGSSASPSKRDKGKDGISSPTANFSRNHVSAEHGGEPDAGAPSAAWDRWEEPL